MGIILNVQEVETDAVVGAPCGVAHEARDLRHRFDANNAFDRQIGLVCELTGEVVRTELIFWDE